MRPGKRFGPGTAAKWALALLAACLAVLPGCGGSKPILKIGLSAPFTAWDEPVGYSVLHAVRLALRESYQRGGAGGYMLELVALDDRNDPVEAALQAREMEVDPDILAAIGGLDNEVALAAAPAYSKAGLAFVTIGTTAHALTDGSHPGIFRLAPRDAEVARVAVAFAAGTLQARRVALIQDPAEAGLGAAMAAAIRDAGLAVAYSGEVRRWQFDFGALVGAIAVAKPDAILFAGRVSEAAPLLAALRTAGVRAPLVAGPAADDARLGQIAGVNVTDAYVVGLAGPATSAKFVDGYSAAAGAAPPARASLAYDATGVLISAVERAARAGRPTRASVAAELAKTNGYAGVTGTITFNAQGENQAARPVVYALTGKTYPGVPVRQP